MSAGHTTTAVNTFWTLFVPIFFPFWSTRHPSFFSFIMSNILWCSGWGYPETSPSGSNHCRKRLWLLKGQPGREGCGFTTRWSAVWWCRTPGWPPTGTPLRSRLERRRSHVADSAAWSPIGTYWQCSSWRRSSGAVPSPSGSSRAPGLLGPWTRLPAPAPHPPGF